MSTLGRRHLLGFGVAAAVALAAPIGVGAEEAGSIAGRIVDAGGAPVAGAPVVISSALLVDGEVSVVADSGGAFALASLEAGFYDVSVEIDGFKRGQFRDVQVAAGRSTRVEISLEPRGAGEGGY